jgi:hypothetical protein
MKIIYHENKTFYYSEEFDSYNVVFNKWKYFLIYIKREILINKGKIILSKKAWNKFSYSLS